MRKQVGILTLWSFLFVVPVLLTTGPNIVTLTFLDGAQKFWAGLNPYSTPSSGADLFHYSPFFAFVYGFFGNLPPKVHALLWCFINSFVFWAGVSAWFRFNKKTPWYLWVALGLCAMEMDISLRYQQSNSLVMGLILLGTAAYSRQKWVLSGIYLALATNIKIIPFAIALSLFWPFRKKYWVSFVLASLLLILLPSLAIGWTENISLHWEQFVAITSDMPQRHLLDLKSTLERWQMPLLGLYLKWIIVGLVALLFPLCRFVWSEEDFPWEAWLTLGIGAFLLLVPRVESPTFVFIAPCYLLLMRIFSRNQRPALFLSMFLITFVYTSAWPKAFKMPIQEFWTSKSLGVLVLWLMAVYHLITQFWFVVAKGPRALRSEPANI